MKLNRDDEYYKLIYNWVDDLDFIEGYEFLEAKSPNTDAFDHMHMEVKNVSGDVTVRLDANGIMISCGCGCMSSDEIEYFQICEVQKQLNDMITKTDRSSSYWETFNGAPHNFNNEMNDIFDRLRDINANPTRRIESDLRRISKSIDRVIDRICELDMAEREEYLEKLKDVLGKEA